jgi:hypothetical protein
MSLCQETAKKVIRNITIPIRVFSSMDLQRASYNNAELGVERRGKPNAKMREYLSWSLQTSTLF